jgi:DNA-binding transcriptional LysR family regulator
MRGLNLDQLRTLLSVVELGSFSAAARKLNLSQPAVSLQVRELENRLGLALIERLGKKAYPTKAGGDLLDHARRLLSESEAALLAMRRHREGLVGRVRIGTSGHYLIYCLPPLLRKMRIDFPTVEVVITTGIASSVTEQLLKNEVDVGLITLPVDERVFAVTPVRTDPILAFLPSSFIDIPAKVTPDYASRHPLILEHHRATVASIVDDWLQAAGVSARPAMAFDNLEAIRIVVAAGLGISFLDVLPSFPPDPASPDIVLRPLDPPLERSIGLVVRRDKPADPALEAIRETLLALIG